jgi:hypothetical protein
MEALHISILKIKIFQTENKKNIELLRNTFFNLFMDRRV